MKYIYKDQVIWITTISIEKEQLKYHIKAYITDQVVRRYDRDIQHIYI